MRMIWKSMMAVAAVTALTACETNTKSATRDADVIEKQADRMEKDGDRAEASFDKKAEALRNKADVIEDGVTYEVARVDKAAGKVFLTRKDLGEAGVNKTERDENAPETSLQSGRDLTITFMELDKLVEGDKAGNEIAEDLHEGENVTIFMDASGKLTKIKY